MQSWAKKLIVVVVIVTVAAVLVIKSRRNAGDARTQASPTTTTAAALPKIVCLGAGTCIPCKAMEPVREELRRDYAGKLVVEFNDIRNDPTIAKRFGIRVIPTTIFYDGAGIELARAEGFMSKDDILAQFHRLGVPL